MNHNVRYGQAMSHYVQGRWSAAWSELEPFCSQGLAGRLAHQLRGQAMRHLAAEAAEKGDLLEAQLCMRRTIDWCGKTAPMGLSDWLAEAFGRPAPKQEGEPCPSLKRALELAHYGRSTEALLEIQDAIGTNPDDATLPMHAGLIHAREDRHAEAERCFRDALRLNPDNADTHRFLGLTLAATDRFRAACASLQRAVWLRPMDLMLAHSLLLTAQAASGDFVVRLPRPAGLGAECHDSGAIERIAEAILAEPDLVQTVLAVPSSEMDAPLMSVMDAALSAALSGHETYADLHHRRALVLGRGSRLAEAADAAERALAINPKFLQARILLGKLLMEGDPDGAVQHLRRALASGGDYADVHASLGLLYERMGQLDLAREEIAEALRINGDYAEAIEAMNRLAA